ncbi:M20/M25/M40 family metallo-hydrolase [Streptosporangium sp. NPDC050855]|uniref:M20/M25/M40 family metallo-hydrolase n=1 Tax=Streptosporangium sp. NPDC050855 TaxID=3366194 RepID=UPI0037ACEB6E
MSARAPGGMPVAILAAAVMALSTVSAVPAAAAPAVPAPAATPLPPGAETFGKSIKIASVRRHLERFQSIADAAGGVRAAATPGYDASADYVADRLRAAGYRVTTQEFKISFFQERTTPVLRRVSPTTATYEPGVQFRTMTYSGSGKVTAPVRGVDLTLPPSRTPSSTSGCEASDFAGFVRGHIALMQRGTCSFQVKAELAQAAGASAVIIFNEGQIGEGTADRRPLINGSLNASSVTIPALGADFATGAALAARGTTVSLSVDAESAPDRRTHNVIAESRHGDPDRVVMLGAHLDSVAAGPGINDNGSGSAAVLETALAAAPLRTRNRLRFAFWGAEELGLLGSKHYVAALPPAERAKIRLYLNFDMIASPNHVFGIYDGDSSDPDSESRPPAGSAQIEQLFEAYFKAVGQPYQDSEFTGRSDYGPFIAVGIPSGGLFTGAEGIKSPEEAVKFGGVAGTAYDKCYHQACDTIANIGDLALAVNTGAIAAAAFSYAYARDLPGGDTAGSFGTGGPRTSGPRTGAPGTDGPRVGADRAGGDRIGEWWWGGRQQGSPRTGGGGLRGGHDHAHDAHAHAHGHAGVLG